ncbi:50S ribosomal protein L17 [Desulfurobacterium thermolithotrophum DSM 11699]|uniref:Large ribosomal subunit protein bL17 n=1 Tax=Desulfurobacterium thermolithotrophum (strain DSM 11699 / BSA) TaxID=868864 RepID=F0S1E9_DESTD|nr:50S ribosomal protein L17 [Desulfurobacterium thermolithotrophum]ADY72880.1 50S ribosomal protein L17 [Desulfurobacterium thermolithotrophum DSM 11699]
MRHRVKGKKLGRPTEHRLLMLRNLVTDLIEHGKVVTTVARAKELKRLADKVINKAKQEDKVKAIREVLTIVTRKDVAYKLVNEIAPKYANRNGGYTRLLHYSFRKGDAAPTAIVMLVEPKEGNSEE